MATIIRGEVRDPISWGELICCLRVLSVGGGQGAGNHRPDSGERGKNATILLAGEEDSGLVDPTAIPLSLVFTLGGKKQSSTHLTAFFF